MGNILIICLALVSGLATFLGVILGVKFSNQKTSLAFGASFAASIMILTSVFELIPEGYSDIGLANTALYLLIGIASIWLISIIIPHLHSIEEIDKGEDKSLLKASYLIAIGLLLHDFPEGFAVADSFKVASNLGAVVFLSTFLHNIPEGYVLAVASSSGKPSFSYWTAFLSSMATLVGAILAVMLLNKFLHLSNYLLVLTAGTMIFISIHELFPLAESFRNGKLLALGVTTSLLIYFGLAVFF